MTFARRRPLDLAALASLAVVLALFGACFEPPVREQLELRFLGNGAVVVSSTVEIRDPKSDSEPLARRLEETRRALEDGTDDWSRRFAALDPAAEKVEREKRLGTLTRAVRRAVLTEPRALAPFFSDTALDVSYTVEGGTAELAIRPGPSGRASRAERQRIERALDSWSGRLARYFSATAKLWAYLDDNPDRARDCLGAIFEDVLPDGEPRPGPTRAGLEAQLVAALEDALGEVVDALRVAPGDAYSLDELSQLAYDPFPAELAIALPGPPLEVEGFEASDGGDNRFVVRRISLWAAFESLEGRYATPDPALAFVRSSRRPSDAPGFDLDAFASEPRRATAAPTSDALREVLDDALRPPPLYRATWRADPDTELPPFRWEP